MPAVFLGALGTSLYHPSVIDLQALAIASSIATGACVQAFVGLHLVRRTLERPVLLEHIREVVVLQLLGGPLSCLVNATVGTATLFVAGFIPGDLLPFHWATWWAGDVMGVFVFAPILLLLFNSSGLISRQRKTIVGVSLAVTFLLVVYLFHMAKARDEVEASLNNS